MNFIDTNVIVYFGGAEAGKFARAASVVNLGGIISVQVLNEFANVTRNKNRRSWAEIEESVALVRSLLDVRPLTVLTHEAALRLAQRYNFHLYDALIVASALEAGCDTLYSEDMHHGLLVEHRLTIVNPFLGA
ncbi:MAG: PIN domain-containing protein [Devosia nanyangense]|uniref:PIN domain-containing protein n=1 Tax=Devosia nanyangense TaxID=1228055 RepID=A0A933NWA9_9HYPH|nr:PIN domain-containing protein [Devosia nanyangense]